MNFSRRDFVRYGSVALVTTGLVSGLPEIALGKTKKNTGYDLLHGYNAEIFRNQIGTEFQFKINKSRVSATLSEVTEDSKIQEKNLSNGHKTEGFFLKFQTLESDLVEGFYPVSHPTLGKFNLFVSAGKGEGGSSLNAIFNRI